MENSAVTVNIMHNDACILNESSRHVTSSLKELIDVLKDVQKQTNDCLTKLTHEAAGTCMTIQEKSDSSDDDLNTDDSGEDESDKSPKRPKLKS